MQLTCINLNSPKKNKDSRTQLTKYEGSPKGSSEILYAAATTYYYILHYRNSSPGANTALGQGESPLPVTHSASLFGLNSNLELRVAQ